MYVAGNAYVHRRVYLGNTIKILVKAIQHRNGNELAILPDVYRLTTGAQYITMGMEIHDT